MSKGENNITRITNGLIEKFWQYRKKRINNEAPANYIYATVNQALGQASMFIDSNKNKKTGYKPDKTDGDSNNDDNIEDNDIYCHHSTWAKNRTDILKVNKEIKERVAKRTKIDQEKSVESKGYYQEQKKKCLKILVLMTR